MVIMTVTLISKAVLAVFTTVNDHTTLLLSMHEKLLYNISGVFVGENRRMWLWQNAVLIQAKLGQKILLLRGNIESLQVSGDRHC